MVRTAPHAAPPCSRAVHSFGRLACALAIGLWADVSLAASITLTSTVHENGINSVIGTGVSFTPGTGFDFSGQDFASLASIDSITLTASFFDLDSAPGNLDFGKLTLTLDNVDTGIVLNGFPDSALATQTITDVPRDPATHQPSTAVANAILTALQNDGHLSGGIHSTDIPSFNGFQAPADMDATLTITGQSGQNGGGGGGGGGGGDNWAAAITHADQVQSPFSFVTFNGTISNSTGADLLIDSAGLSFDLPAAASSFDFGLADDFLATLGVIPTSGYAGPLFFVELFSDVPTGIKGNGSLDLTVESPGSPGSLSLPFSLTVVAVGSVAEPHALLLAMTGLLAIALCSRRRDGAPARRPSGRDC